MSKVNQMRMSVQNILIMLMHNIGMDTPENIEEITDFVFEDVQETADPVDWHSGDVAIGFRRWIEAQAKDPDECTEGLHIPSYMNVGNNDLKNCIESGQHLKSCDDDGFCNNCGYPDSLDDFINDEEFLGEQ